MAPLTLTNERIAELKESARYANSHGGGYVSVPANDLLSLLPADAEPVAAAPAEPIADKPADTVAATDDAHAEQIAEEIHEKTGAKTEVVNGVPIVHVPQVAEHGPVLVADPVAELKPADAEPERGHVEDGI